MARIHGDRLLTDLRTLREFGSVGTGVVRPTFSDVDMAARRWLRDRMTDAGLGASIDGVANVVGRSRRQGPALLIGSHSDTQPEGGWLDGAMGVIAGIEVARSLAEDPATEHLAVDVAAWSDEEGTYSSCLGSASFVGDLGDDAMHHRNADGESVGEAIERVGLAAVAPARHEPDRHVAYLESHIEQGPHLEATGRRIGVVTSIVGIRHLRVHVDGQQNHAGTTPMADRHDAAVGMFDFGVQLQERMRAVAGPTSVWTTGRVEVEPGAASIVPGHAFVGVQWRDADDAVLEAMERAVLDLVAELDARGPCRFRVERTDAPIVPTHMDRDLRRHLADAAEANVPGEWVEMPSAAGHDAMVLAHHMPCAMLFIPSIGGISHDFAEDSHDADIVTGCQVLADTAVAVLGSALSVSAPGARRPRR